MEVQDGAQITAAASLRRFDSASSVGERRQLPLEGKPGARRNAVLFMHRVCVDFITACLFNLYYIQN